MSTATEPTIEQRLATLEAAVAELRQQLAASSTLDWLERINGIMKDEPAFDEVVALGRAFQRADRPSDAEDGTPPAPAGQNLVAGPGVPLHQTVARPGEGELIAGPTTQALIKRAKMDDQGRLIPLTPAEAQAEAESIREMLDELRSIPSDPDEDDAEFFRAIDSHRLHRPLFEGLY